MLLYVNTVSDVLYKKCFIAGLGRYADTLVLPNFCPQNQFVQRDISDMPLGHFVLC